MHPLPTVHPVETGDDVLLDVREDDEWQAGHAPGAVHVPLHELPGRLDEVRELAGEGRLPVVCRVGARSAQATAFLRHHGVDAHNVDGGMLAWARAGLPLTAGAGEPRVV